MVLSLTLCHVRPPDVYALVVRVCMRFSCSLRYQDRDVPSLDALARTRARVGLAGTCADQLRGGRLAVILDYRTGLPNTRLVQNAWTQEMLGPVSIRST
jgi:hypothetical protein